ncbi:MAG: hypothetical protein U9N44_03065 [Chloroflexota bacterium]|nr:hypothetical protein [Chloroflexota bacterium]
MEKALATVSRLNGPERAEFWRSRFERFSQMPGSNRKFRRIITIPEKDQLSDYLVEIIYALIFAGLGFQVQVEPYGEKGADFKVLRRGEHALLEIRHFRSVNPGPQSIPLTEQAFLEGTFLLEKYGDPERAVNNAFDKLAPKFKQISNENSIIAIWNDADDFEDIEMESVHQLFLQMVRQYKPLYENVVFMLYGSDLIRSNAQLYCYPLKTAISPEQQSWMDDLRQSSVEQLIQEALL